MADRELLAIHAGKGNRHAWLHLREGNVRYGLYVQEGRPLRVQEVKGRITTSRSTDYNDLAVRAEKMGKHDPMLDPICAAVLSKGWSPQNSITMKLHTDRPWRNEFPVSYDVRAEALAVKKSYTGLRERYWISDGDPDTLIKREEPLCWAVLVDYRLAEVAYRATSFSIDVQIAVPRLYDNPTSFAALLKAIEGLPHSNDLSELHPVQVAAA